MTFTPDLLIFVCLIQLLSYGIKGLIGFGNPLVSGPLLSMRLDNVVITPMTLMIDCPVNGYIAWKNRHNFQWRRILPMLLINMCGVVPGTLLLRFSMPWIIKLVLGIVVVLLGLEMATREARPQKQTAESPWVRTGVTFLSGICAGLFGINMFLIAYLQRKARDYDEFKGSICFLFFGENIFRFCTYLVNGIVTREVLLLVLVSAPAAVLAMAAAGKYAPRADGEKLQKGAIVLFILGGISIVVKSLLFHT